jgi:energy-coupling factor transporter ATP-binding protein EcfA2
MTEPIVRVSDLTYYYQNETDPVLRDVNLEIEPGEFVLLIGPSGCGKSTLALCLNGIIPLVMGGRIKGQVYVDGIDARKSSVYELATRIGIVFQDPDAQLCNLYVDEEVAFGPANLMMPRAEIFSRVDQALQDVGETDVRHKLIYEISGGQKHRVTIASILAMQPKIVVFDEPTANLDPLGAVEVFDLMRKLNQEHGMTILVIEHNVDPVMCHAGRVLLMENGTIQYSGPPRQVAHDRGRFVLNEMGLRIPLVCQLALGLQEKGIDLDPFPLTVPEAAEAITAQRNSLQFAAPPRHDQGVAPVPEAVIQTEHLSFAYADGTQAVKDVSLQINRGDVVSIIGENGSGKTTFASLLVGLNKPTSGKGTVCGLDINRATIRDLTSKVGYVFQYPEHQFVEDTVYKEVAFSLQAQKRPPEEIEERVSRTLKLLGVEQMRDKHPLRLSMGQKRRLSVATMLILHTDILILDEPTTGQDRKNIDNIMEIMQEANSRGTTVILITHDMNLVAKYSNRIVVMDRGEVVFCGSKSDFFRDFGTIRSGVLVLPEIYELAQILRDKGLGPIPEVFTVLDLVNAVEVR